MKISKNEKKLSNLDLKYVLSIYDQETILSGASGCLCSCINGASWYVVGTLLVNGWEEEFYETKPGDICTVW